MDTFEIKRHKVELMKYLRKNLEFVKKEVGVLPENMIEKCPSCRTVFSYKELSENLRVCPSCGHHFKMTAYERIDMMCDEGSFHELAAGAVSHDVLDFPEYRRVLKEAKQQSGLNEAYVFGTCRINARHAVIGVLDSSFIMGSMGSVVGEKIALSIEIAQRKKYPLVIFSASGGARMQEGTVSLMQMAKTASAIKRFDRAGGLFISILTDPTTGGVLASYASLGDIIIAEPGALIGFAGPRVIEQTIGEKLPEGFQRSEYLLEHGFLDMIVDRIHMKETVANLMSLNERRS